jgi:hypothetical protein
MRVFVRREGEKQLKAVRVPDSYDELLELIGLKLRLSVAHVVLENGAEVDEVDVLEKDDVLVVQGVERDDEEPRQESRRERRDGRVLRQLAASIALLTQRVESNTRAIESLGERPAIIPRPDNTFVQVFTARTTLQCSAAAQIAHAKRQGE